MELRRKIRKIRKWCPQPQANLPKRTHYSTQITVGIISVLIISLSLSLVATQYLLSTPMPQIPIMSNPSINPTPTIVPTAEFPANQPTDSPTQDNPATTTTVSPTNSPTLTPNPNPKWQIGTLDHMTPGPVSSLALDKNGNPCVSYYDSDSQNLMYNEWQNIGWITRIVDSDGDVGMFSHLVIDANGNPHIAYSKTEGGYLKYATRNGATWTLQTIDSSPALYSDNFNMALDTNGKPHICYYDANQENLKYATMTGTTWNIQTVDTGDVGGSCSIAIDTAGNPHISYFDIKNGDLKYAKWTGTTWSKQTVDSYGDTGAYSSIAIDADGNPHISYRSSYGVVNYTSYLKYTYWNGTRWNNEIVDSNIGTSITLILGANDDPQISYESYNQRIDIQYTTWNGTNWNKQRVNLGDPSEKPSFVLDKSSKPHICVYDNIVHCLYYTTLNNGSWTHHRTVAPSGGGAYSSIAIDDKGNTHISYSSDGSLKYASITSKSYITQTIDRPATPSASSANVGSYNSLALDSKGHPHISYINYTQFGYQGRGSTGPVIVYRELKYTWWDGTAWNTQTIDANSKAGYCSLALDSKDNPQISYYDYKDYINGHAVLKYAKWNGIGWEIQTVTGEIANEQSSLAINSADEPHISYQSTDGSLKLASRGWFSWDIQTVDTPVGSNFNGPSLVFDSSDQPHISYACNGVLKYASWNQNNWNITIVDNDPYANSISLKLDANNWPHISYGGNQDCDLKYAVWNGTAWTISVLDEEGNVGFDSSLGIDTAGYPHISYFDGTHGHLKYASFG